MWLGSGLTWTLAKGWRSFSQFGYHSLSAHTRTQVLLVSAGMEMYFGARDGMVPWFSGQLGYPYQPTLHGVPSDWVMDLVNVGFDKPEVSLTGWRCMCGQCASWTGLRADQPAWLAH